MDFFKQYTFEGFVSTEPFANYNMLGSTGMAWAMIVLSGGWVDLFETYKLLRTAEVRPGLYGRARYISALQSPDDYYGLVAGLSLTKQIEKVDEIRAYGRQHFWIMNSDNPGRAVPHSTWFWRFPALIAHVKIGCNFKISIFTQAIWALMLAISSFKSKLNQDAHIQSWLMMVTYIGSERRYRICDWAVDFTTSRWIKRRIYLSETLADYIGNDNHPLVLAAQNLEAA